MSQEGHSSVLCALSDFRSTPAEQYRFQYLLDSIRPVDEPSIASNVDTTSWEYRSAIFSLINALTDTPEDLEERIMLREEFTRRGLNEIMTVSRYL